MVFRITYPTGYLELNVGNFFGTANKKQLGKVLRLAKQNCNEEQRTGLIGMLKEEIALHTDVIIKVEDLRVAESECLSQLISGALIQPSGYEKTLRKQRDRLRYVAELVEKARWDG